MDPARAVGADGEPMPGLRDRGMRWLLFLALALQVFSWSRLEGYQLADSVEYLDRALAWAEGGDLGADRAVRSFAFSLVFVPMFALADWIGLEDLRPLVWVGRAVQMGLALALVLASARLGARVAGRRAGFAAGFLVAVNPVYLRYAVSPVAGIAAALFAALGFERLLERCGFGRSLRGGMLLGLALLCSYKTLLAILLLFGLLLVRDRLKHAASWLGLGLGVGVGALAQIGLDRWVYGRWGASLLGYVLDNVGSTLTTLLLIPQKQFPVFRDMARWVYQTQSEFQGYGFDRAYEQWTPRSSSARTWYFEHFDDFIVWPALLLGAVGLLCFLRRPAWRRWIPVLVAAGYVAILSFKGDKSYRLLLPILPLLAAVCAAGWARWRGIGAARSPLWRRASAAIALLAALPLGVMALEDSNPRFHGAYWKALDWIEGSLEGDAAAPARMAGAYHWALFLRASPRIEQVKFPCPLESWRDEVPESGTDEAAPARREAIAGTLEGLDWLVVHLPVLSQRKGLFEAVNRRFRVEAAFYDQEVHAGLGPVFVLRRSDAAEGGWRFFDVEEASWGFWNLESLARFVPGDGGTGVPRLDLIDFEVEPLPGTGLAWITYRWRGLPNGFDRDWKIMDRVTAPDGRNSFQNNHHPAYGLYPTSTWTERRIEMLRESYLLVASADAFYADRPHRPLGGPYRRGDLIPCALWMEIAEEEGAREPGRRMFPGGLSTRDRSPAGRYHMWTRKGRMLSGDGYFEVGRFFLPVEAKARVSDDGRPIPE